MIGRAGLAFKFVFPVGGQEIGDLLMRIVGDAAEDVFDVFEGLDILKPGGGNQGVDEGRSLGSGM